MPGSSTTPGRADTCDSVSVRVAFRCVESVGTQNQAHFVAQWLACMLPCQRFANSLTAARA
jgi:hypothetical protein